MKPNGMIRYGTEKTKSAYLAALFAIVTWSVTFANIRALLTDFSSLEILVVRFAMAWAVLWAWCLPFGGRGGTPPSRKDELLFVGMGFTGISGYQFLENCAIFYTNASKYFGKVLNVAVTFSYNGGRDTTLTETLTEPVYVLDRTAKYVTEADYRSVTIDPFYENNIARLEEANVYGLHITTFADDTSINEFEAVIDWSGVARLLKNQESDHMFSAKATTTRADGVKVTQNVTIPVTIMNRTVVDTDFNPELEGSDWEFLYTDTSKSATTTDTYRSEHGEYFNIVFSTKAGEHPEQFIFENQFSYRGLEGLPKMIEFTFENDEIRNYALTYENVPDFSEVSLNSTTDLLKADANTSMLQVTSVGLSTMRTCSSFFEKVTIGLRSVDCASR
jgi:hypothetical protein